MNNIMNLDLKSKWKGFSFFYVSNEEQTLVSYDILQKHSGIMKVE